MIRKSSHILFALVLVLALGVAPAGAATVGDPPRAVVDTDRLGGASPGASTIDPSKPLPDMPVPLPARGSISALETEPNNDMMSADSQCWYESPGNAPWTGATVDAVTDEWDLYWVYFETDEQYWFELTETNPANDFDLFLWSDYSADFVTDTPVDANTSSTENPSVIMGDSMTAGWYYVGVRAWSGSGGYTIEGDFISPDDILPGIPAPASPVARYFDTTSDMDHLYNVYLGVGDVLSMSLAQGSGYVTADFDLYLYPPGSTDLSDPTVASVTGSTYPKTITYTAPTAGYYVMDIYDYDPTAADWGTPVLTWKVLRPIYRFYNFTNNTHFFTDSNDEKNMVLATWPNIFRLDGVAYYVNPANNSLPLYRFYNRNSKSHFYTASLEEANNVIARYSAVFSYDGPSYSVSPASSPGKAPVYRFFNLRNGSHFYTASSAERDMVAATWPTIYRLEGEAFSLGQ